MKDYKKNFYLRQIKKGVKTISVTFLYREKNIKTIFFLLSHSILLCDVDCTPYLISFTVKSSSSTISRGPLTTGHICNENINSIED